jgi:hypothetical protein
VRMRDRARALLMVLAALLASELPAHALKPQKGEEASLKACEKSVCEIILSKDSKGKAPHCDITKTWAKDTIKKGENSMVSWAFGDTRCQANLKVAREEIVAALTKEKYTLQVSPQTVNCVVEQDGKAHDLTATAAPKLKFKRGKADKIWINLKTIEGPENVTGTIRTIAAMEDKIGIFHGSLIKSVNKFIHKRCAKKYGPGGTAEAEIDDEDEVEASKKPAKSKAADKKTDADRDKSAKAKAADKPEAAKADASP